MHTYHDGPLVVVLQQGLRPVPMDNPVSGKVEPKVIFGQKLDDVVCGVGAYNPQ